MFSCRSMALHSLFELFSSRHCPYFYITASNTTILFLGMEDSQQIALMTPTSPGLRHALTTQGVEFSLPLSPEHKISEKEISTANSWLEEMTTDSSTLYPHTRCAVILVMCYILTLDVLLY